MNEQQDKTYDMRIKLTMMDYYRYYFSLFNLKPSSLLVNFLCGVVILVYAFSLLSLAYISSKTGVFDWKVGRGMLIDIIIIFLFSLPFIRTYMIALKDAKTHNFLDKYIDITITDNKFCVTLNNKKLEFFWKKMYKIFEFRHGFALFIDDKELAFVLPKRYFKDKELLELVRTKLFKNDKTYKRAFFDEKLAKGEAAEKNAKTAKDAKAQKNSKPVINSKAVKNENKKQK
ncbi:MAG: YcxB family protein [Pseudomonadota bacterium]